MFKLTCGLVLALCAAPALPAQDAAAKQADNTKVNKRDRSKREPTADQQKENRPDREIAAEIRRNVVADKSLSIYAHNVKIIVQHGMVTLKGPVHTEEEKKTIVDIATKVAGDGKVKDEISVKADKSAKAKKNS